MKRRLRRYNPDIVNELKDYMREKFNGNILGTTTLVQRAIDEIEQLRAEYDMLAELKLEGTQIKDKPMATKIFRN